MFTIQGYFIFIKTGCAGRTLNTPLIHRKTFPNNLLSDNKCRLPEFWFKWAIEMMRRMKRSDVHIFCFWINHQITCPFIVELVRIWKVSQPEDISLSFEAQVLTLLWASSLSLPFYHKVDRTWNNVASDTIFLHHFFVCCLGHHGSTDDLLLL